SELVRWTLSRRRRLHYPRGDIGLDRPETSPQRARRHGSLEHGEREAGRERERGDGNGRGDHTSEEVARLVDDDVAEAAAPDDAAQGRRRDDEDGGGLDPREDQREGQRQLDPEQDLVRP